MAYSAKIIGKVLERGQLKVQVQYKSDSDTFEEYIVVSRGQPEGWLTECIKARLADLNELPAIHEAIVTPSEEITHDIHAPEPKTLTPREEYAADLQRFEKFVHAVARGLTTVQHDDFVALKKKLADNFTPEYLDLF